MTERRHKEEAQCGRREQCPLTDEEYIEEIAEKAAEKAIEKLTAHVYQEVGKSVVSKALYIIGACSIGLYLWLKSKGII
jgi:tetrahydromethanopterin S-methyltransferase subunit G